MRRAIGAADVFAFRVRHSRPSLQGRFLALHATKLPQRLWILRKLLSLRKTLAVKRLRSINSANWVSTHDSNALRSFRQIVPKLHCICT